MNIKKGFLTALAAVTAVTSVFAMTVSAAPLGDSTGNIDIINVTADGINKTNAIASIDISSGKRIYIRTTLPAKLSAGDYRLMISSVADKRTEDAFDTAVENTAKDIYEVTLQESDGNDVSVNNIEVVISETLDGLDTKPTESDTANVLYNKAFGIDGVTFADLNAKTSKDNITFETNGYSRFVLANVENTDIEPPPEPTGEPISDISIPEVDQYQIRSQMIHPKEPMNRTLYQKQSQRQNRKQSQKQNLFPTVQHLQHRRILTHPIRQYIQAITRQQLCLP